MNLINSLIKEKWLRTSRIINAFKEIKRQDFMTKDHKVLAEVDEAMPIGHGQTISQPLTVAFMMEQLQPKPGDKILDIGSGSGWTTALLAYCAGLKGKVIALEVIPELKEFGEENVSRYNFIDKKIVKFIKADGSKGYEKEAPYDKILASASAVEIPQAWKDQLKIKGKIVAPVAESIWVLEKESKDNFKITKHPGFIFVPLV